MKERHELRLVGITYNQIESGVYALILEEVNGERRIPIVIGYPEAQAIECKLQNIKTPRPLTHDLIKNMMECFGVSLTCVDIYRLPNGVFAADLVLEGKDGSLHHIDARSSDAIAIAIRTGSPIYTDSQVLEEAGINPRRKDMSSEPEYTESEEMAAFRDTKNNHEDLLLNYSEAEILEKIANLASEEKYEEAARLQEILRRRQGEDK